MCAGKHTHTVVNNHIHSTTGHHSCLQQTARDNHIAHHGIQSSRHNPQPVFTQTHTGKHTMQSHQVLLTHPSPYTSHTCHPATPPTLPQTTPCTHTPRHGTERCTTHHPHIITPPSLLPSLRTIRSTGTSHGGRTGSREEQRRMEARGDGRVLGVGSRTRSRCRGA